MLSTLSPEVNLRRLQARGEDELRILPSGNGIDLRRCVQGFCNAELARIMSPEKLRLTLTVLTVSMQVTTCRSGRSSSRVSGIASTAPAARTKRSRESSTKEFSTLKRLKSA
uniref:Uncharacterized protein n=1 Tax=Hyaloperonospora arabidopsidis (strain Emoy2) TaxID=559515 RepID=M4BED9_HYAAE